MFRLTEKAGGLRTPMFGDTERTNEPELLAMGDPSAEPLYRLLKRLGPPTAATWECFGILPISAYPGQYQITLPLPRGNLSDPRDLVSLVPTPGRAGTRCIFRDSRVPVLFKSERFDAFSP